MGNNQFFTHELIKDLSGCSLMLPPAGELLQLHHGLDITLKLCKHFTTVGVETNKALFQID